MSTSCSGGGGDDEAQTAGDDFIYSSSSSSLSVSLSVCLSRSVLTNAIPKLLRHVLLVAVSCNYEAELHKQGALHVSKKRLMSTQLTSSSSLLT